MAFRGHIALIISILIGVGSLSGCITGGAVLIGLTIANEAADKAIRIKEIVNE